MGLRESLPRDGVEMLRPHEPITLGPDGVVRDAIALMQEHSAGCVFVTEHDRPIGVFTERDVLRKVLAGNLSLDTPISEVMTPDPRCIQEGSTVATVINTMYAGGFRHMPVVDDGGSLKSVVSVKRVVEYLVEHFPSVVFNLPPEPTRDFTAREGA